MGICIYKTTDGGSSWSNFKSLNSVNDLITTNDNVIVGHSSGTYAYPSITKIDKITTYINSITISGYSGNISSLTKNPTSKHKIIISGWHIKNGINRGFVFESRDEGENWRNIFESDINNRIYAVNTFYDDDTYMVFGSDKGIFLSEDDGRHWDKIHESRCTALSITGENRIFAAVLDKLILSSDNGKTWEILNEDTPLAVYDNGIKFDNKNKILYIGTSDGLISLNLN